MIDALPLLLGPEGYQISRSVRLRSSASAYFNRTPAAAGNRQTWTWSAWFKRGSLTQANSTLLFAAGDGTTSNRLFLNFNSTDTIALTSTSGGTATILRETSAVYRDVSAWYHIVLVFDTTQATANNRVLLYVNGVQVTAFGTINNLAQNANSYVNNNIAHRIGDAFGTGNCDGYLTEVNFIDGQALTPASFGETNPVTGVWQPKKYTGTYGTNGFYLNFSDNSSNTATTIGKDYSGNGNNWTPNNISVTSGATYDSMLDVPTQWVDGGNGRGNYAVMNPLDSTYNPTEGGLSVVCGTTLPRSSVGSMFVSSGKWYMEVYCASNGGGSNRFVIGLITQSNSKTYPANATDGVVYIAATGDLYVDGVLTSYGATFGQGNTIGIAVDFDLNEITFFKNDISQGTYTGKTFNGDGYGLVVAHGTSTVSSTYKINFGQRPFAYTPPTGFKALNTLNLPTPTILKGNQYFDVSLWTGTGSAQSITNSGSMQPDFVWIKSRNNAGSNHLYDALRGSSLALFSDATSAESSRPNSFTSFNSNGFTLGSSSDGNTNLSTYTYVGWQWKEGATQGFDIVTWTQANPSTLNHSLGVKPAMIIIKGRGTTDNWVVWHQNLTNQTTYALQLNTTTAQFSSATLFNSTAPTSTQFTVGTGSVTNGTLAVAYLFSEVAGFSKFGSYTGNGSADGPFVFTGFRPAFVLIKVASGTTAAWILFDTKRDTYNVCDAELFPNLSSAETSAITNSRPIDILSNGFKIRGNAVHVNGNTYTYIYAVFAENPFKNALAR